MMQTPLNLYSIYDYSQHMYPTKWIVTRTATGTHRHQYRDFGQRVRQLSQALRHLGVQPGDRVGTLAWNDYRHLEIYFAVPLSGSVLHTINLRLPVEHVRYIINHAQDRVLFVDETLLPLLAPIKNELSSVQHVIVLGDHPDVSQSPVQPALAYEELLHNFTGDVEYDANLSEESLLGLCYTSATTGNPKGVAYSHRGIVLHSLAMGLANTTALAESDTVLPVVPMFHANAWGLPFAAVWFGANIVLPGAAPTPRDLVQLMAEEAVTVAAGVPTVWLGVARELSQHPVELSLRMALCGGSAAPPALIQTFEETFHVPFAHAYGMTETSPLATFSRLKSALAERPAAERLAIRATQGLLVPGLSMRLVRDGIDVPWDGVSMGELWLRGPWVADEYYHGDGGGDHFEKGWLKTGDVATIDPEGYVRLVDRTKDLVKSGGEWISSVDLENTLMAHDAVFEAAVVGVTHPKWDERPLAFVVFKEGKTATPEELKAHLSQAFPKWWLPDAIIVVDEIPKTSVGKFMKRALRDQYHDYLMPQNDGAPT
ncbi:MAG: fatty-acid--CoA ligase [Sulfobacillus acidophilus]|uniref:Fatty-acid--CoA ligase n=1 Tax=Sulfobacillus acidophilus TaxID=53633 RepID=A0A2T2WGJ1_9FIRM|nr:MAG: fatty-acid--CoA ligase [Sulfobacillus acidophilus]